MKGTFWLIVSATMILMMLLWWAATHHYIIIEVDKPLDVATLALAAATLVLTGVALVVAVLTLWGYEQIKSAAIAASREAAIAAAKEEASVVAARTVYDAKGLEGDGASADGS